MHSIPKSSDDRLLRFVKLGTTGYRLVTWDTYRQERGKSILGYAFWKRGDKSPLFTGAAYGVSPMHAIDSDRSLRSLLTFLTLRPGDTDRDYFDEYTPRQMAFAHGDAEYLSLWADEEDTKNEPLVDLPFSKLPKF